MVQFVQDLNLALQSAVTWLMTLVLVVCAAVMIIGFLKFMMDRRLNKMMFYGFVLFTVCTLLFTKIFGYRMEFFSGAVSQIGMYALWYLFFLNSGVPAQPPPDTGGSVCIMINIILGM